MQETFLSKTTKSTTKIKDIISIILGGISLIVALVTGYFDANTASNVALILVGVIWITWITLKLINIEKTVEMKSNQKHKPWIPYVPKIQFFNEIIHEIDNPLKRLLIKPDFLEWEKITIVFWVNVTEDFLKTDNNRYLFSYKTETIPKHNYKNVFYLGRLGASSKEGEKDWQLLIGGENYNNQKKIEFRSNHALLGWKLFTISWRKSNMTLDFKIDAGKTYSEKLKLTSDFYPIVNNNEMFTIGSWTDWEGGLSYLDFYNFRIYKNGFTDGEISELYNFENKVLKNTNAQHMV